MVCTFRLHIDPMPDRRVAQIFLGFRCAAGERQTLQALLASIDNHPWVTGMVKSLERRDADPERYEVYFADLVPKADDWHRYGAEQLRAQLRAIGLVDKSEETA